MGIRLLRLFLPPLGARHHTHYHRRPVLLYVDTALAILIFALAGTLVWLRTQPSSEPALGNVAIAIDGPAEMVNGNNGVYHITVTNTGITSVQNATVQLTLPAGVQGLSASPGAEDRAQTRWTIPALPAGASQIITLTAIIRGAAPDEEYLRGHVQYTEQGRTFAAATSFAYRVTTVQLAVTVGEPNTPILQGTAFPVTLTMTSDGTLTLEDLTLEMAIPSSFTLLRAEDDVTGTPLQWRDLSLPANGTVQRTLTLRTAQRDASQEVTARVLLPTGTESALELAAARRSISVLPKTSLEDVATAREDDAVAFAAEARYTSEAGIQFGYGPLPPRVGETTTYRIFWVARFNAATFQHGTVRATLPASVAWGDGATATAGATPTYDANRRTVIWTIASVPQGAASLAASFDIRLTPNSAMIGNTPTLVGTSRLTVTDRDGVTIVRTAVPITTALPALPAAERAVVP